MARRNRSPRRRVSPDPRYQSTLVTRLTHRIMYSGKKSLAERIVYSAFDTVETQTGRRGVDIFEQAVRNASPVIEVKPRRVGGSDLPGAGRRPPRPPAQPLPALARRRRPTPRRAVDG